MPPDACLPVSSQYLLGAMGLALRTRLYVDHMLSASPSQYLLGAMGLALPTRLYVDHVLSASPSQYLLGAMGHGLPLPSSWTDFRQLVSQWFPGGVYDTKLLSRELPAAVLPLGTGLGDVYSALTAGRCWGFNMSCTFLSARGWVGGNAGVLDRLLALQCALLGVHLMQPQRASCL
jgi:hypothetical protein